MYLLGTNYIPFLARVGKNMKTHFISYFQMKIMKQIIEFYGTVNLYNTTIIRNRENEQRIPKYNIAVNEYTVYCNQD